MRGCIKIEKINRVEIIKYREVMSVSVRQRVEARKIAIERHFLSRPAWTIRGRNGEMVLGEMESEEMNMTTNQIYPNGRRRKLR